ncbi:MAG: Holliday junction branch migration protein RuvA [Oscillospiraceae bacterium]|nr:Holliday junction branch migration protein RuvA [Oscillospiraceae bacterium]
MLYALKGTLVLAGDGQIAVECGGVAYLCRTTLSTLSAVGRLGDTVQVYTLMQVRNEAVELFGFADKGELDCFKMLVGVSGVGARIGLGILSSMTPERFALCVAAGDHKPLVAAPGVGKKLAERIILELRDKVGGGSFATTEAVSAGQAARSAGNIHEAVSALVVLGYSQTDAALAVSGIPEETPVEEMIKQGLRKLAKKR